MTAHGIRVLNSTKRVLSTTLPETGDCGANILAIPILSWHSTVAHPQHEQLALVGIGEVRDEKRTDSHNRVVGPAAGAGVVGG